MDFLPGVEPYESTLMVDFFSFGERVRMVVTLSRTHDEEFTKMASEGLASQFRNLDSYTKVEARSPRTSGDILISAAGRKNGVGSLGSSENRWNGASGGTQTSDPFVPQTNATLAISGPRIILLTPSKWSFFSEKCSG